jgi:3-(methylthio)propanoyl-CoA dehydrogenase
VAISERAYQQAREYALDRVQGRTLGREDAPSATIIGHPDVRRMLMDMKARVEAMRALAYYTAGQMDRAHGHVDSALRHEAQTRVDLLIPVVKGWCTESALGITSDGVQVHGGMGFIEETGASQHMRDARITTIYEGTTGIQANDLIGRKLARDGGAAMKQLIAAMFEDAAAIGGQGDAMLGGITTALDTGLRALAEATDWLLAAPDREAAAGAVPYLKLCGTVIGGWVMARGADAATAALARSDVDADFFDAKRITAHHYSLHVLPEAGAMRDTVVRGAATTLGLRDAQF